MTPRTRRTSSPSLAVALLVAAAGASLLASCGTVSRVDAGTQQIRIAPDSIVAVDVENFHGNVRIVVDPTLTAPKPVFKKRVSWWVDEVIRKDAQESITVRSRTFEQDGRTVVSIKTSTRWPEPEKVWVNLTLYVPRCDGVRVWNRGGKVTLEGVGGAIQVDNAEYAGNAAPIEVRTDQDIIDPVLLATTRGDVSYQVGPGSAGQFTLDSADDREEIDCAVVRPDQVYSDGKVTTASINKGDNAVVLRSGKGRVLALVLREPMKYTNKFR